MLTDSVVLARNQSNNVCSNTLHAVESLQTVQKVYFRFFTLCKLTEKCHFKTDLWTDPYILVADFVIRQKTAKYGKEYINTTINQNYIR